MGTSSIFITEILSLAPPFIDGPPFLSIGKDKILYSENFLEIGPVDGLIGYWPMNGNLLDYSLNNNDGTASGATVIADLAPRDKNCYEFLAAADKVELDDIITLSAGEEWSLSFWGYKASYGFNGIGGNQTVANDGQIFFFLSDNVTVNTTGTNASIAVSPVFPTGEWFHFTITHTAGNSIVVYKNGSSVGSGSANGNILLNKIGDGVDFSGINSFTGHMFDFRIYNKVLSTQEISILSKMFDTDAANRTEMEIGSDAWYSFGQFKEQL